MSGPPPPGPLDPEAAAALTDAVLQAARDLRCEHAQVRVERIRTIYVGLRDGALETTADDTELGVGLRVVHEGANGFAASVALDPAGGAALAHQAVAAAQVASRALEQPVQLAAEPTHGRVEWSSPYRVDPTTVPLGERVELLAEWSRRVMEQPGIDHVSATVSGVTEDRQYTDLTGTTAVQRRIRTHPQLEAVTLLDDGSGFESMRTLGPPAGRGWEYLGGDGWDWDGELEELPVLLAEKAVAPSIEPGRYDLVVDPTNLWLTIHESVGHATELDRALGFEAAYAGTSFATPDQLGSLRYGSPLMHVTGDRTVEHGLATVAIDDEGVAATSFDLVRDGVLVGYQMDRSIAAATGLGPSNGCAFADSPLHMPIQRMANVSLMSGAEDGPTTEELIGGVENGLYIAGDKSWSIDMQRYNFQFTGQRFFAIRSGRLVGQRRDVAYQAVTTDFWSSLQALGGASTYHLGGAFNCGKGQPGQVAPVSHGCPSVVVGGVNVLNARQELGQ